MHRHSVVSHHREILRPSSEYSFLTDDLRAIGIDEGVIVSHEGSEAIDIGMVNGIHELKGDFFNTHYLIHLPKSIWMLEAICHQMSTHYSRFSRSAKSCSLPEAFFDLFKFSKSMKNSLTPSISVSALFA